MKTFAGVVIITLVVQDTGNTLLVFEWNGVDKAGSVDRPDNHIAITICHGKARKEAWKSQNQMVIETNHVDNVSFHNYLPSC